MFTRLTAYLDSIKARDPAPRSRWEILLYPGVWALGYHRIAHRLFRARFYFLARAVNHFSRFATAIDIHPGATIGRPPMVSIMSPLSSLDSAANPFSVNDETTTPSGVAFSCAPILKAGTFSASVVTGDFWVPTGGSAGRTRAAGVPGCCAGSSQRCTSARTPPS